MDVHRGPLIGFSAVDAARRVIERAIRDRIFPAAVVDVGNGRQSLFCEAFGTFTFGEEQPAPATNQTLFDLASLTKVVATTSVVMELVRVGAVRLDEPVAAFFDEWRGTDRDQVTVRDLLAHTAGLPARLVDRPGAGRREFEHDICTIPLEYAPRSGSVYSDLGFILLGFLAADRGSARFADQVEKVLAPLYSDARFEGNFEVGSAGEGPDRPDVLTFAPSPENRRRAAPTLPLDDDTRRGRILVGEVHDPYAAALGGVAGHAGLFGTASALGQFARAVLRAARGDTDGPEPFSSARIAEFTRRGNVTASSRALGWDTMLPTSSCGTRMSTVAFGHVGFTGTSLWIDPDRDRYFVLLTNRACGGGSPDQMRVVRGAFHDALGDL